MDDRIKPIAQCARGAILVSMLAWDASAQPPASSIESAVPNGPPAPVCARRGRVHRMFHHVAHTLQDDFIGYPETFAEPPLGSYVNRQLAIQVSKADAHRFTVYHTDFLPETDRFSPTGASRFNLMYSRLAAWQGPIIVEWTPDQPALAEARRQAILDTLSSAGTPWPADRVVIGPSAYPGAIGVEAVGHHNNMIGRAQAASQQLPLPPTFSSSMGVR